MAFFKKFFRNVIKPSSSPGPHLLPDNGIRSDNPGRAGMTIIVTKGAQQALELTKRSLEETDTSSSSDSMSGKSESGEGQTEDFGSSLNANDIDLYATGSPSWANAGVIVTTWSDSMSGKPESLQGQTEDFSFGLNADDIDLQATESPSWAKPPVVTTESLTRAEYEVPKRELSTTHTLSAEQENTSPQLEKESIDFDEAIAGSLEQQDSLDKFLDSPCSEESNPTSNTLQVNVNESESGEPGLVHPQTTAQVEKPAGRNSDCTGMTSEEQINAILAVNESESGEEPGVAHPQTTVPVEKKLAGSNSDYMASEEQVNVTIRLFEMGKIPPGYDKSLDAVQMCEVESLPPGVCAAASSDIRLETMSLPSRISGDITCTTGIRGETLAQTKGTHPIAPLRAGRIRRTLYCHDEYSAYYY
jgi:hypothetical protein